MKIYNVHERTFKASEDQLGDILDSLSGPDDKMWPGDRWPPMRLDKPLSVGASGGHGPVRYSVTEYVPGRKVSFEFAQKGLESGLLGGHSFDVRSSDNGATLRHILWADSGLIPWLKWAILIRPLHDALLEDALDKVERGLTGTVEKPAKWSAWVRVLRSIVAGKN